MNALRKSYSLKNSAFGIVARRKSVVNLQVEFQDCLVGQLDT